MSSYFTTCHFEISYPPQEFYRYFRVRMLGTANSPADMLVLTHFEVFGSLFKPRYDIETESQ